MLNNLHQTTHLPRSVRASTSRDRRPLVFSERKTTATNLSLRRESETRAALRLIEDGVNSLEENVSKDREAQSLVRLDASKALGTTSRSKVNVAARDDERLAVDGDVEVGQLCGAREDVAALVAVVRRAADGRVVVVDNIVGEEHKSGAGVGDGGADGPQGAGRGSDAVAAGGELPEAAGAVDGGVGDGAGVLCRVDEAEVVGAGCALP
jgi:hypothetical protein